MRFKRLNSLFVLVLFTGIFQVITPFAPILHATTTTYAPNQATSWTVPSGVSSITVTVYGGGAGSGATDGAGVDARTPGARGKVIATFSVTSGQSIGIYPGNKGSNGATGTNSAGGSGGSDTDPNGNYNGGNGGNSGGSGSSGSGGGGGAASTLYIAGTLSVVAGGSGGGGGSANVLGSATNGYNTTSEISNQTNGGNGTQTTTSCAASNDGGGGGGGGGGRWGSNGGGVYVTGSECAGYGGYRGNNFIVGTATSTTNTTDSSGTSAGSIEITYVTSQTISISSLGTSSKTYPYSQALSITTSGSSGTGAITFAIASGGTASDCALSSSASNATITSTSSGTCLVTATIAADSNYSSATSSTATFTFNKANQSALTLSSTSGTYLTNLKLLSSGGSDTGTVTFSVSSSGTAGCSISNSDSLTSTSAGTCQVVVTKAATNNYFAAYDTQTITLGKADLTLTLSVVGSSTVKYGSTASTTYSTNRSLGTGTIANITGTISYSVVSSPACSVGLSTGIISMNTASGTCSVRVSLASDNNYSDTNSATVTVIPTKADTLTVTASAVNMTYTGSSQAVPYQYSISGLKFSDTLTALSYSYSGTSNAGASTSGSGFADQAGTYTITPSAATITNSDSYTAISYATGTLTIARASRTISGSAVGSLKYGSSATISSTTSPSSNSDGSISYSAGASTACAVVSGTGVTTMQKASGSCSITPSITQGNNYLAATGSAVTISPAKADAITVSAGNASATYSGSAVTSSPTYSVSGLIGSDTVTVSYQYSGTDNAGNSYSLSSTPPTNAGTFSIIPVVTQTNSDSYTATATLVNGSLTINRATRTLAATTYSASSLKYGATASVVSNITTPGSNSDGSFSYAIGSGCSINVTTGLVTATSSSGTCSQTTTVGQGNNYEAATAPSVSFALSKADTVTVSISNPSPVTYTGSSANVSPSISTSGLVNSDSASGATFSYSRSSTCATGGTCSVGDTGPGGGIVFYVSGTAIDAADGISDGGFYLEAAPSSFSKTTFNWCEGITDPYTTTIGGTSAAIGSGALNTKIVSARCSGGAVYEAANLTLGGKSDWFLPSQNEQIEMYNQRAILGFGTGDSAASYLYWGSTETANWHASSTVPWSGVGVQNKGQATPYWPIRAFSPTATTYAASTTPPTNAGSYTITPTALILSGGRSTDNYLAVVYETGTLTINKANQSIFSNYSTLEAVLGSTFQIYPFGGSGDGAVYLAVSNGTATGCSASLSAVTASTSGTCVLTVTKSANENYNQAQSTFTITFYYFVPAAAAPVSSKPTEIAVSSPVTWNSTATAAPSITSISPTSGAAGTVITISGVGLDGVNSVKIGRKTMTSITGVSSTSVTAVVPVGATSGPIVVTNSFGSDFSTQTFTVSP